MKKSKDKHKHFLDIIILCYEYGVILFFLCVQQPPSYKKGVSSAASDVYRGQETHLATSRFPKECGCRLYLHRITSIVTSLPVTCTFCRHLHRDDEADLASRIEGTHKEACYLRAAMNPEPSKEGIGWRGSRAVNQPK